MPFAPGLVGGHCIGVDPYYLTTKAEELGYLPEVILAGRRINNNVGTYVAQRTVKMLSTAGVTLKGARVAICGLTFKENVPDLRNSRVPDIIDELGQFGVSAMVHDPMGDPREALEEYGVSLCPWDEIADLDAMIYAVSHNYYQSMGQEALLSRIREGGVIVDVKSTLDPGRLPRGLHYWSL
jgi:UDP-N-acetyl-D-galactosamine dehydrogenase